MLHPCVRTPVSVMLLDPGLSVALGFLPDSCSAPALLLKGWCSSFMQTNTPTHLHTQIPTYPRTQKPTWPTCRPIYRPDFLLDNMQIYEAHAWAAGAWQDVFADLVQGQLQQLFLALLQRIVAISGVHVEVSCPPGFGARVLRRSNSPHNDQTVQSCGEVHWMWRFCWIDKKGGRQWL